MSAYTQLEGECTFYHGLPRSTKSLKMTKDTVIDYFAEGRLPVANYHLYKVPYIYKRVEDLIDWISTTLDDVSYTLCIDEIQNEADGRDFSTWTNKDFSKFIAQCGKRNIKIRYASQFGGGAELRLRQITDRYIYCNAIRDLNDRNQFTNLLAGHYEHWSTSPRRRLSQYILPVYILKFFYRFYKTREIILPHDFKALREQQENSEKVTYKKALTMIDQSPRSKRLQELKVELKTRNNRLNLEAMRARQFEAER